MAIHYLEEKSGSTETKKRKVESGTHIPKMMLRMKDIQQTVRMTENGTLVGGPNGLVTPSVSSDESKLQEKKCDDSAMDTREDECPCGHFHGPGYKGHHDVKAVGMTNKPLFRGPD